jgi:aryl-alcohol dehydrogenase-like predicted oxidoreductase
MTCGKRFLRAVLCWRTEQAASKPAWIKGLPMKFRRLGKTGIDVSVIGLGGHEFHPDGEVRGFHDNYKLAVTAGHVFPGFGLQDREKLVKRALDIGINIFDCTIDSEKKAMGRILKRLHVSHDILIQTRPEGMVYTYDPENRKMADYALLKAEVQRILGLLKRDAIDILNFAFMQSAVDTDPEYLDKIGDNIRRLKNEGLIRFASADTFSGEALYLRQFQSGHFDTTFINYNITEIHMNDAVLPTAHKLGIGVVCREPFMKGGLFRMAEQAGFTDRACAARLALQWILSNANVASVMVGVSNIAQLEQNVQAADPSEPSNDDRAIMDRIMATQLYRDELSGKQERFRVGR